MNANAPIRTARALLSDLQGLSRLGFDAAVAVTDLVEATHASVVGAPASSGAQADGRSRGIAALAYGGVRATTRAIAGGVDATLGLFARGTGEPIDSAQRDALVAMLNGVCGDRLAATGNPLAVPMRLRRNGRALALESRALAAAIPDASGDVVVLVHGLCMNDRQWRRAGHDHGAALERDLGVTAVYLHYNSGLHMSTNGRAFADALAQLRTHWPVPVRSLALVGHSMGGLVARSACRYGARVDRVVCLGTPHHGAPLERGGNWLAAMLGQSAYTAPIARLGQLRSAGITDLRFGCIDDADWRHADRFAENVDTRVHRATPAGVRLYAMAATLARRAGTLQDRLLGDGFVPLASALGEHDDAHRALAIPASRRWTGYRMHHWELLSRPEVYAQLRTWLAARASTRR